MCCVALPAAGSTAQEEIEKATGSRGRFGEKGEDLASVARLSKPELKQKQKDVMGGMGE